MALDEQLRHTFDLVANRLRDEVTRELTDAATAWAAKAQVDRDVAVEEAAARARAAAEADAEARLAAAVSEAETHGRTTGNLEGRTRTRAAQQRLADGVRALDAAGSLTDILDTLATCSAREANRAVVLVLRDGAFQGWHSDGDAASMVVPIEEGVAVTETARRVLSATADAAGRDSCAFPIALNGDVVAIVYGEGADHANEDSASSASSAVVPRTSR